MLQLQPRLPARLRMIFEIAHQMALAPIIGMMVVGRKLPRAYWLVALAYLMSWFGDSLAWMLDGSWQGTYLWLPLQLWLVFLAFMKMPTNRVFSLGAVILLALISWTVSGAGPDVLLTIAGSVVVLFILEGRIAPSLYVYFGLGTLAYLWMTWSMGEQFLVAWYSYQACRLLAYSIFLAAIFLTRLELRSPHVATTS